MAQSEKNTENSANAPEQPKKSGLIKLIIFVFVGMILGGAIAFGAIKFLGSSSGNAEAEKTEVAAQETKAEEKEAAKKEEHKEGAAKPEAAKAEAPIEDPKAAAAANGHAGAAGAEGAAVTTGPEVINLDPFVTNLNDGSGRRFIKLTMSIEVDSPEVAAEVKEKMPQIRDMILLHLSSLSYEDISSTDGKLRLRSQLLNRINSALTTGKVQAIYFSEFVIQ